ncbi:MAG: hypothetical protein ACK5AZ_07940 [Bryobacteraceae bacterium]
MAETIYKLQPTRTMHLRGFDRRGAAAAFHSASETGFTVSGVFRDAADFAVLVLWDADNFFEHPSMRYLPDLDFSGMVLDFDLSYTNLQWVESLKYPSIDWPYLDYIKADGTSGKITLRDCITSRTGRTAATRTWTVNGACQQWDRVTLWFQNYAFDYIVPGKLSITFTFWWADQGTTVSLVLGSNTYNYTVATPGGETGAQIAGALAAAAASDPNANADASSNTVVVTPKANTGASITCSATWNGADTLWVAQNPTEVVAASLRQQINTVSWPVGTPVKLSASGSGADIVITANGGTYGSAADGNFVRLYEQHKTETMYLTPAGTNALTGGLDPSVAHFRLDFSALGLTQVRQLWLTFAPKLPNGAAYADQEWSAVFSNWTVSDPQSKRALKVAGPSSVKVNSKDDWVSYSGGGWAEEAGWYAGGYARRSSAAGDSVRVRYACQFTHDVWIGTSLYRDRGRVDVKFDGVLLADYLDCYAPDEPPVLTRRRVKQAVPAGEHVVEIIVRSDRNSQSTGNYFYFDYLQAVVAADVPNPTATYSNVSPALDYDTDHTYKLPPQRVVWNLDKMGFHGDVNEYVGVFWWNQRRRISGNFHAVTVTFSETWGDQGVAWLQFGGTYQGDPNGTLLGKTCFPADTTDSIAAHFAAYINVTFVGVWASASGNVLTITTHSPTYDFTFWAWADGTYGQVGTVDVSGDLRQGVEGTWQIDAAATPVLNRAARDWHEDFFQEIAAKGWTATAAFSMELVDPPPDDPGAGEVWAARFRDNTPVLTATGFGGLSSTHCAFVQKVSDYQKQAYKEMAGLMAAAGLTPWLQFGEFVWWFFTNYDANANPAGGMAFYDADTAAAATASLGRPLATFLTPTDDPAVNGYADANFLRQRIKDHCDAISGFVKATYPNAKFEILWPYDVNYPTPTARYKIGGRLNRYVNLPSQWTTKAGSGLDRFKTEGLAFGSSERNIDQAKETIRFPYTVLSWPKADTRYLIPWFNGGCPWTMEYLFAKAEGTPHLNLWAFDHLCLLSWPVPLPVPSGSARVL